MRKLTPEDLWKKIKSLEGKTVYTIVRKRPNLIERVTDTNVIIKGRKSRPSKDEIVAAYETLCEQKELRIGKGETTKFTYYVVHAILSAAVPDQIVVIRERFGGDFSGIRLKPGDC